MACSNLPDISSRGHWSASSSKHGYPPTKLIDSNPETFWQSDGQQPHHLSVQFNTRQSIHAIALYLDYEKDESYTPCKLLVFTGTNSRDMQLIRESDITSEPQGWIQLSLSDDLTALQAHFVRIELPLNFENGRDVRVRLAKILGPPPSREIFRNEHILPFTSAEFYTYDSFR
ncbi:hypothetical protein LPJ78_003851 [Coemansia sp. RSA 989]|nr:hypothetical protein LPJ68_003626 [Coemansia sp. RSA 1086]KAJ1748657.1 hypothetical protein LPJ79_004367 [Coemansia sp. RSA 1821]KAJ1863703.1 hypothetical protein LPJ78_003851 [Coemansia sp. RSA 989]KAJ1871514.1 hypothetical protein LPJ55_003813 [Coemansia sp. RSA 990]KAJ2647000.1 hypothetical protein IWW40_004994 [Coemansia sp. RSA 1250]KAJ2668832.1 hypothetical protein IWW42_004968 [Coemansia sp. RSA 1085]